MKTSRLRVFEPAPASKGRFDAETIEQLRAQAQAFYEQCRTPIAERRADAAEVSASALATMRDFIIRVDGSGTLPEKYTDSPMFVTGIFVGSVRRSKVAAYMNRKRTP